MQPFDREGARDHNGRPIKPPGKLPAKIDDLSTQVRCRGQPLRITVGVSDSARAQGLREARDLMAQWAAHLDEACLGSVSEIFDGDAPHAPRGWPARAARSAVPVVSKASSAAASPTTAASASYAGRVR